MMLMFYALMSLSFFSTALAQVFEWGPCPDVEPMRNFIPHMTFGRWYEAKRYFTATEFTATCVTCDVKQGQNNTLIMSGTAISPLMGTKMSTGDILIRSPYESHRALLKFKVPGVHLPLPTLAILGTDYTSHMVVYSCANMEFMHFRMLWILTREKEPLKPVVNKAIRIIRQHRLNDKLLMHTDQRDCEVEPDEPKATQTTTSNQPATTQKATSEAETTAKPASEAETPANPASEAAATEATTVAAK